jgi:hypothetical protein
MTKSTLRGGPRLTTSAALAVSTSGVLANTKVTRADSSTRIHTSFIRPSSTVSTFLPKPHPPATAQAGVQPSRCRQSTATPMRGSQCTPPARAVSRVSGRYGQSFPWVRPSGNWPSPRPAAVHNLTVLTCKSPRVPYMLFANCIARPRSSRSQSCLRASVVNRINSRRTAIARRVSPTVPVTRVRLALNSESRRAASIALTGAGCDCGNRLIRLSSWW